jgi:hypothetical protein
MGISFGLNLRWGVFKPMLLLLIYLFELYSFCSRFIISSWLQELGIVVSKFLQLFHNDDGYGLIDLTKVMARWGSRTASILEWTNIMRQPSKGVSWQEITNTGQSNAGCAQFMRSQSWQDSTSEQVISFGNTAFDKGLMLVDSFTWCCNLQGDCLGQQLWMKPPHVKYHTGVEILSWKHKDITISTTC